MRRIHRQILLPQSVVNAIAALAAASGRTFDEEAALLIQQGLALDLLRDRREISCAV